MVGAVVSGISQIASNVINGETWSDGLGGAMVGGAVSGALSLVPVVGTVLSAYGGAYAESITEAHISDLKTTGDVSFTKEDWQTINQEGLFNGTKDAVKGVLSDILTGADLNKVPSPKEIIDNGISDLKNNIKVSQYVKGFKQATKSYLSFMSFVSRVRDYLSGQEQKSSIPVLGPYQHFA